MSVPPEVTMFLSMLSSQVPVILVCLVSFLVIFSRTNEEVRGRGWALMGFGLLAVLCVLVPAIQSIVMAAQAKGNMPPDLRSWILTGLAVFWSLVRGFAYLCLLFALIARPTVPSVPRPPYEPR